MKTDRLTAGKMVGLKVCKMDVKARLTLILMGLFWAWIIGVCIASCSKV